MIREVKLASYLPPYMQEYQDPTKALSAEDPEFTMVWRAAEQAFYNRFILTADEYGIARYEKMLGIFPEEEDTLGSRRKRVQSRWYDTVSYTYKILLQKLSVLCGDKDFTLTHNFSEGYTLYLKTGLELYGQVDELEKMLDGILPCNLVTETVNDIEGAARGRFFLHGGVAFGRDICITSEPYAIEMDDVERVKEEIRDGRV